MTSTNQSITAESRGAVEELRRFVERPEVLAVLREAEKRALAALAADPAAPAAVENVVRGQLPACAVAIGSVRVAVFREGCDGGPERHPNSTQYLYSLSGRGETRVLTDRGWRIDRYGVGANLEDRLHLVPEGVWHLSAATPDSRWSVVALHTATEVQDEYELPVELAVSGIAPRTVRAD
jgi:hypothetical protein